VNVDPWDGDPPVEDVAGASACVFVVGAGVAGLAVEAELGAGESDPVPPEVGGVRAPGVAAGCVVCVGDSLMAP